MGSALLVSSLLALMRNQIAAAKRVGVKTETIKGAKRQSPNTVGPGVGGWLALAWYWPGNWLGPPR